MVTQEQQSIIDHAQLQKINGWQHIKVKGTPYECGFQEGYLLADEYQDALRVYKFMTLETFGMTYEWFAEQALKLHRDKIPTRWLEELRGMAEGLTAAGIPTTTDDMIASTRQPADNLCTACFTGSYPLGLPEGNSNAELVRRMQKGEH